MPENWACFNTNWACFNTPLCCSAMMEGLQPAAIRGHKGIDHKHFQPTHKHGFPEKQHTREHYITLVTVT